MPARAERTWTAGNQQSGKIGCSLLFTGGNFGATQGASTVTFNGTSAGFAFRLELRQYQGDGH